MQFQKENGQYTANKETVFLFERKKKKKVAVCSIEMFLNI